MLEYISGERGDFTPTSVVLVNAGIGYLLQISMQTYAQIENKSTVLLYVHEVIREDAHELYGFFTKTERALFRLLISVSGVGPSMARLLLSSYNSEELVGIIQTADVGSLCRAKGVGSKTAQRIIVDLQNKVQELPSTQAGGASLHNTHRDEALFALIALGFPRAASEKVLDSIVKSDASLSVEQMIKLALQQL
ncbi:MAG: Holliday junction branch migration protein RuvA [Bacteroides sp.]